MIFFVSACSLGALKASDCEEFDPLLNRSHHRKTDHLTNPDSVKKGTPNDKFKEGFIYFHNKKFREAAICYQEAVELGSSKAQFNLGLLYEFGVGVPASLEEAIK